jgi:thymidylate synthase ThyX
MAYSTKIILDSISPVGRRLTTWELTYPRFIHAEIMTHRIASRNSASSRAIPSEKMLARIMEDPAMPIFWGKNQKGMQAAEELSPEVIEQCKAIWLRLRDQAVAGAKELAELGLHKQLCNRPTEPWMYITVILSATSFTNWDHLRNHWMAQPEFAWIAKDMVEKAKAHEPQKLKVGEWHLPLITDADWCDDEMIFCESYKEQVELLRKVSTGRCARVSLLNHDGVRDLKDDVGLHDRLLAGRETGDPLHMSPFEHQAMALADPNEQSGNYKGWQQYRKTILGEHYGEVMA